MYLSNSKCCGRRLQDAARGQPVGHAQAHALQAARQSLDILGRRAAGRVAQQGLLTADGLRQLFVHTHVPQQHGFQMQEMAAGPVQLFKAAWASLADSA